MKKLIQKLINTHKQSTKNMNLEVFKQNLNFHMVKNMFIHDFFFNEKYVHTCISIL